MSFYIEKGEKAMKLGEIGEFGLIEKLREMTGCGKGVVVGIGDDCAVLRSKRKGWYDLLTIDTLVEGVHFRPEDPPSKVGRKAMAINISDIAAMGGLPGYAVISLAAPRDYDSDKAKTIYRGMKNIAEKYSVDIVGGDTVRSPKNLVITVALTGSVEKHKAAFRSGARPGNRIYVTGTLGGSIFGKHLSFTPRVDEARFLVDKSHVTSMIDLSDGLASDLRRVLDESLVGAAVRAESIPVSTVAGKRWKELKKTPLEMALTDGEDFELLFTVPSKETEVLEAKWRRNFKLRLTCIGEITRTRSFNIIDKNGKRKDIAKTGYDHFR